jgi:hypothetical protein
MANGLIIKDDYFRVVRDDLTAFDSRRPSVQLFPTNTRIVLTNRLISFPNLLSTAIYFNRSADYAGGFSGGQTYAESWSALIGQEWGPDESTHNEVYYVNNPSASIPGPSTRRLAEERLGSVPSTTTYLDVRVRLTRTKSSPVFINRAPPAFFPQEGEWMTLVGGSCPLEYHFPMSRGFEIVREGTSVYLRRYQSVRMRSRSTYGGLYGQGGASLHWVDGGDTSGWRHNNHGTAEWSNAPSAGAWLAVLRQSKGPDTNGNKRAPWYSNATNPCVVPGYGGTPAIDYGTNLRADIIIHPGRHVT